MIHYHGKDGAIVMDSKCYSCPRTKEYIDVGGCPNCGAKILFINTATHEAICDICHFSFGIPMIVTGSCWDDVHTSRFEISFHSTPTKQQLLDLSKLIGLTGTEIYRLFQKGLPVQIRNVPMITAYQIRKYLRPTDIAMVASPPIDQYHLFEKCWHI